MDTRCLSAIRSFAAIDRRAFLSAVRSFGTRERRVRTGIALMGATRFSSIFAMTFDREMRGRLEAREPGLPTGFRGAMPSPSSTDPASCVAFVVLVIILNVVAFVSPYEVVVGERTIEEDSFTLFKVDFSVIRTEPCALASELMVGANNRDSVRGRTEGA